MIYMKYIIFKDEHIKDIKKNLTYVCDDDIIRVEHKRLHGSFKEYICIEIMGDPYLNLFGGVVTSNTELGDGFNFSGGRFREMIMGVESESNGECYINISDGKQERMI